MTNSRPFTRTRLLLEGLSHYWRSHLSVALGTAIATAVLAGALVVGDSVKASLRRMTLERLGAVDFSMTGPRFFREQLATDVVAAAKEGGQSVRVAPAILATAAIETSGGDTQRRASGTQVIGCDDRFWEFLNHGSLKAPSDGEVVLSRRTADQLQAKVGDQVSVLVEIPQTIPRDSLLGDREQTVTELLLNVSGIAEEQTGMARFGLNPSQQLPRNAFVNLRQLQEQLNVAETAESRSSPVAKPARINSLFFARENSTASTEDADVAAGQSLTTAIHRKLGLADLHLRLIDHSDRGYISLESEQMILDPRIVEHAHKVARELNADAAPVLVYLLNEVRNAAKPELHSMYAVAAGLEPDSLETKEPPPPASQEALKLLASAGAPNPVPREFPEVVIDDWLASDLEVKVGDILTTTYHQVGDRGELPEVEQKFKVAGIAPLVPPWDDQGLVPYVPGITDAETFRDWRQPFPMKMEEITPRDEEYWKLHRATPKLFVPLAEAQKLWQSRYGDVTSVRIHRASLDEFEREFLATLPPTTSGMIVQPIKRMGLDAAKGTTDFAGLFLGFSFFLIGAAAILIALLFRLGVERRIRELGLLTSVGWTPREVFRHALLEAFVVVAVGVLVGLPLAVGYAGLMIHGLKTWWNAAVGTQFLYLAVDPAHLIGGGIGAMAIAVFAVWIGLRASRKVSPRGMLSGETEVAAAVASTGGRRRWLVPAACALAAAVLIGLSLATLIPSKEAFGGISWVAVSFFLSGSLVLTAGMTAFGSALRQAPGATRRMTWRELCLRNAARNPRRSSMTAGLVAAAAFLVAAVASGKRNPAAELPDKNSGNGGFLLVAESSTPILYDLNTEYGRSQIGIDVDATKSWPKIQVAPFRVQPGENASCLNLYQTQLPTILALPDALVQKFADDARFRFIGMTPGEAWQSLLAKTAEGITPVLGDVNTLQYSLHKGPGDQIPLDDAPTRTGRKLEITGMFDGSVFQGVLVMAESHFLKLYPERTGFQYFLVEASSAASGAALSQAAQSIADVLETQLRDYGVDAERVSVRLADFLAVQNTYLSTFQTLGGLGLLLGVFGLFAVTLRNVLERRGELALMRAVGLPKQMTGLMVVGENLLLVGWGLATGIAAALLAMAPQLVSTGGVPPWSGLGLLAGAILLAGGVAAVVALKDALAAPIVAALSDE